MSVVKNVKQILKEIEEKFKQYSNILYYDKDIEYVNYVSFETYKDCVILFLDNDNKCTKERYIWHIAKELHKIEMNDNE